MLSCVRAGGADQRALMHQTPADATGKGCQDFGITDIEPRRLDGGIVGRNLCFELRDCRFVGIVLLLRYRQLPG